MRFNLIFLCASTWFFCVLQLDFSVCFNLIFLCASTWFFCVRQLGFSVCFNLIFLCPSTWFFCALQLGFSVRFNLSFLCGSTWFFRILFGLCLQSHTDFYDKTINPPEYMTMRMHIVCHCHLVCCFIQINISNISLALFFL